MGSVKSDNWVLAQLLQHGSMSAMHSSEGGRLMSQCVLTEWMSRRLIMDRFTLHFEKRVAKNLLEDDRNWNVLLEELHQVQCSTSKSQHPFFGLLHFLQILSTFTTCLETIFVWS